MKTTLLQYLSSNHGSKVSMAACYQQGSRFKSWQRKELLILNKNKLSIQKFKNSTLLSLRPNG